MNNISIESGNIFVTDNNNIYVYNIKFSYLRKFGLTKSIMQMMIYNKMIIYTLKNVFDTDLIYTCDLYGNNKNTFNVEYNSNFDSFDIYNDELYMLNVSNYNKFDFFNINIYSLKHHKN